ncbi:fructose bisphosphate aldolase [Lapillicoccus sp.]|uniref:fructose bisphosphate aldolase n=1 Tax=Lapillicoccus sp. TaxID=1909287 RepID=UPI003266B425
MNEEQAERISQGAGFVAALDQSGGSTPKALKLYGIGEDEYSTDAEMFDLVHAMRQRIIASPSFLGSRILATILFAETMDRQVDGQDTAAYLWDRKHIVPILKVDQGLASLGEGVQVMKEIVGLDALLQRAVVKGIFGTKMRSVVKDADEDGVARVVSQQFAYADQIATHGLIPIIEPEVDIHSDTKAESETMLKREILAHLSRLPPQRQVVLKLSIPSQPGFYADLIAHPAVMRVVALSGGYSRAEADALLSDNPGLIASFSRALTEGLTVSQTDAEFDAQLEESVDEIYTASVS